MRKLAVGVLQNGLDLDLTRSSSWNNNPINFKVLLRPDHVVHCRIAEGYGILLLFFLIIAIKASVPALLPFDNFYNLADIATEQYHKASTNFVSNVAIWIGIILVPIEGFFDQFKAVLKPRFDRSLEKMVCGDRRNPLGKRSHHN